MERPEMIMAIGLIIVINILWLIGGQFWKLARRFGIPIVASAYAYFVNKNKRKTALFFLATLGFLSAGYGENSIIHKWLNGSEWLTRLIFALLISAVFIAYNHEFLCITSIIPLNILAWQVRAGSLCKIGKYDVLIEDLARATAFAISLIIIT